MKCKVMLTKVGVGDASLRIWREANYRINRIHLPMLGRAMCRDIDGEKQMEEGYAYLLVNSISQNFSLIPGNRYYHFYIDFQTAPPLVSREILKIDPTQDAFFGHLLSAAQVLLCEHLQTNTAGEITSADGVAIFSQFERLLDVAITHLQMQYGIATVENPKIETALRYIEEHYSEPLGNGDIAASLKMDTRYLIRLFQKHMNMPPYQYLTQCRIEHAMGYLRLGKSVAETAYLCGYQSENAFRLAFKRVMGCSPTAILKR